jgi:hypothetical protein
MDGRTEMTRLTVACHNLAKAPKEQEIEFAFGVELRREIYPPPPFLSAKVVFTIFMMKESGVRGETL